MHRGICKLCGATFWETYPGARGEDLCDNHMGKNEFVFLRSPPKPVIPVNERKMAQSRPLLGRVGTRDPAQSNPPRIGRDPVGRALRGPKPPVEIVDYTEENRAPSKDKREETSPGTPEDIRDTENNTGETSEE